MLQVRHIPDLLHQELRRRARARGQTLTAYVQELLEREVARPEPTEVFSRIEEHSPIDLDVRLDEVIREERGAR